MSPSVTCHNTDTTQVSGDEAWSCNNDYDDDSCVTEPSAGHWLYMTTTLRSWQKKLSIIFFTIAALKITASFISAWFMKSQALWGYVQEGTILCFPSLNTILIRRILLSEPCTIIFRMCSGLSYGFTMCFKYFNASFFCDFFHCLACALWRVY